VTNGFRHVVGGAWFSLGESLSFQKILWSSFNWIPRRKPALCPTAAYHFRKPWYWATLFIYSVYIPDWDLQILSQLP